MSSKSFFLVLGLFFVLSKNVCSSPLARAGLNGGSMELLPLLSWAVSDVIEDKSTLGLNAEAFLRCVLSDSQENLWIGCLSGGESGQSQCDTVVAKVDENPECGARGLNFRTNVWPKIYSSYHRGQIGNPKKTYGLQTLVFWALQFSLDRPVVKTFVNELDYGSFLRFIFKHKHQLWQLIRIGSINNDYGENVADFFFEHRHEIDWQGEDETEKSNLDGESGIGSEQDLTNEDYEDEYSDDDDDDDDDDVDDDDDDSLYFKKFYVKDPLFKRRLEDTMRILVHQYHLHAKRCDKIIFRICDDFYKTVKIKF